MSMFDKAKEAMGNNPDKVEQGIDKAEEFGKNKFVDHSDKIEQGADKARDFADRQGGDQEQER
jgi:antitoxin protein of toxin-antitoxin system